MPFSVHLQVTVVVCVTSCVILWVAPQVPYSDVYNAGRYVHYPALLLAATALVAAISLFPGSFGLSRDSKAALIVVNTATYKSSNCGGDCVSPAVCVCVCLVLCDVGGGVSR